MYNDNNNDQKGGNGYTMDDLNSAIGSDQPQS